MNTGTVPENVPGHENDMVVAVDGERERESGEEYRRSPR